MEKEKRTQKSKSIEVRAASDGGKKVIVGYAAVFNQKSKLLSEYGEPFYETIESNAFDEVLESQDLSVKLNLNHDNENLLARTESGTLTLSVDEIGLKYSSELPDTTLGNDVFELVKRGDYFESSFAFGVRSDGQKWVFDETEKVWNRQLVKIARLLDVSIVTDGAYSNTDISVAQRSLKEFEDKKAERQIRINKLKLLEL